MFFNCLGSTGLVSLFQRFHRVVVRVALCNKLVAFK